MTIRDAQEASVSDTTNENPTSDETPAQSEAPEAKDKEAGAEHRDEELSVEDLRAALEAARKDAASQRTRRKEIEATRKELEKRLEGMKSPEDIEELLSQLKQETAEAERKLLAENVALSAGLPSELAGRLQGSTREELEADAKALATLFEVEDSTGTGSTGGTGGLNPRDDSDFDPVEAARKYSRRSR